ncbi:MAG: hypothetical protein ACR2HE_12540 [Casimicrobiaceae bacterium]
MALTEAAFAALGEVFLAAGFFPGRATVFFAERALFFAALAAFPPGLFAFALLRARSLPGFFVGRFANLGFWRTADFTRFTLGLARDLRAGFLAMIILE